jgi:hypothetical protein
MPTPDERDHWLDVLAGKAQPRDPASQQAAALRGYFSQQQAAAAALQPDAEQEKRLLNGLRARGAFAEKTAGATAPSTATNGWLDGLRQWWQHAGQGRWVYGAAALLAFAMVTVPPLLKGGDAGPGEGVPMLARGGVRMPSAQPQQDAERLQLLLSLHGLPSSVQQAGADWIVSADVPAGARAELEPELGARGMRLPADGHLRLRFAPLNKEGIQR